MVAVMEGETTRRPCAVNHTKASRGKAQGKPYVCPMETMTPADLDPRRQALLLYFQGYRIARIAEMLGEKATVHSWKKRDKWGSYGPLDQMQLTTAARYCQLIMKEQRRERL
jgi:hypothetical protein